MSDPRLAVIITCYNYAEYVGKAIESVVSQNAEDIELLVVDDGSADDSWTVIERTGARAYKIENCGQRRACVFACEQTKAPFILFLDADDELCPNSMAILLGLLDSDSTAKIQFPLIKIDSSGRRLGGVFPMLRNWRENTKLQEQILKYGTYETPPTSGNVFRRDLCLLLQEAHYDTAVDGIILLAAPFFGDVVSISTPLAFYRVHGKNDSGFGSPVTRSRVERGLDRYLLRSDHLNRLLAKQAEPRRLHYQDTLFAIQQNVFLIIVEEKRLSLPVTAKVIWQVFNVSESKLKAAGLAIFFSLLYLLPPKGARRLLELRYR